MAFIILVIVVVAVSGVLILIERKHDREFEKRLREIERKSEEIRNRLKRFQ